jgi:LmbE family N-acetylglucosaminyl deacetylase/predicted kinase
VERPEVVVLVGLQASGKSTFYRQRLAATHVHVSRDLFRNHPRPARRQRELLEQALAEGRSVAVDNTSPTREDRAAILDVARRYGARTVCYYFGHDVRASIARNARREGKERVPVVGILATAKRLVAPAPAEGFDRFFEVQAEPGGEFRVQEVFGRASGKRERLLIVAAHPDDETIGAGDLMARAGAVTLVHLTDGVPADRRFWPRTAAGTPDEYRTQRRRELHGALRAGGVEDAALVPLGVPDQEAARGMAGLAHELRSLLLQRRPSFVVTHPYEGGHPDHDAAALVTRAAVALAAREGGRTPWLVEMTSYHARGDRLESGVFLEPHGVELVRELSDERRARKARMLEAFQSQRDVLAQLASGGAERFRRAPRYDFTQPAHDGALWYERLGFGISGAEWRALAVAALGDLRLDRSASSPR